MWPVAGLVDAPPPRVRRARVPAGPEYALFPGWAATEVAIAVSVALSGGPSTPTMAWFAIPVVTLSSRFSLRGVMAGVWFTLALLVTLALSTASGSVLHNPTLLLAPATLVIAVAKSRLSGEPLV
jgi:hypothetical protein